MIAGSLTIPVFVALLVTLTVIRGVRAARHRSAVNRALHELRRPLQALALAAPGVPGAAGFPGTAGAGEMATLPIWQAIRALGELDRELNGLPTRGGRDELIAGRLMADSCVRRWQPRAHLAGARIELRWLGSDVLVRGDGAALAGALENLILNAIEHGGPAITVNALTVGRKLRIEVIDHGRSDEPRDGRGSSPEAANRLRRVGHHGHGLDVVERAVRDHGGKFEIELGDRGSKAVMVVPVAAAATTGRSGVRVNW